MPNRRYFYLVLLPALLLMSACGVLECVDKQIPRESVPLAEEYRFELLLEGAEPMVHTLRCEEFYSASCSERGNYWAVREVGRQRSLDRSTFRFKHSSGKEYDLELPTCSELIYPRKAFSLADISVIYERGKSSTTVEGTMTTTTYLGTDFLLVDSQGTNHRFKTASYYRGPTQWLSLNFKLLLNGAEVPAKILPEGHEHEQAK